MYDIVVFLWINFEDKNIYLNFIFFCINEKLRIC